MASRELAEMTWEEVRDLDRARAVAVLPVGAIEAHGPHLALSTDVVIARGMARAGVARLARRGYEAILLPATPSDHHSQESSTGYPLLASTQSAAKSAAPTSPVHSE